MVINNWSASPSGGAITVNGVDDQERPVKLRDVKRIESGIVSRGWLRFPMLVVQAVMADGERHTLA